MSCDDLRQELIDASGGQLRCTGCRLRYVVVDRRPTHQVLSFDVVHPGKGWVKTIETEQIPSQVDLYIVTHRLAQDIMAGKHDG